MKTIIIPFIILPLFLMSITISPEKNPHEKIFIPYSQDFNQKIVFNYSNYILFIKSSDLNIDSLNFISLLCGYNYINLNIIQNDTLIIKNSIDSIINIYSLPKYIIIIGNTDIIASFNENMNPYSQSYYCSDNYYGKLYNNYIEDIIISRIPIKNQEQLNNYTKHLLLYLENENSNSISLIAPFYDDNNNSYEDIAYSMHLYNNSCFLNDSFKINYFFETNSSNPLYFYDNSNIPDFLLKPDYDWIIEKNEFNDSLYNPSILIYRGHGNDYGTVFPDISKNDLDSINFNNSIFFLFCCLTGNYNNESFAESLITDTHGCVCNFSSSTETFYSYNNTLNNILFDNFNNDIYSLTNIQYKKELGEIIKTMKTEFLRITGINDYSLCEINSYNLSGIPFIQFRKKINLKPFVVENNIINYSKPELIISFSDTCSIFINNKKEIYDTFYCTNSIDTFILDNIYPNTTYYISSYYNGTLYYDSLYISNSDVELINFSINDKIGDYDFRAEYRETLFINFTINGLLENDTLKVFSNDFFIFDTLSIVSSDSAIIESIKICANEDIQQGVIHFTIKNNDYYFSLQEYKRHIEFDTLYCPDNNFLYINNNYNINFTFNLSEHYFDSLCLEFIPSDKYDFSNKNFIYNNINNKIILYNNMIFYSDSFTIYILAKSRFLNDTIKIPVKLNQDFLMFYDPLHLYENSYFLEFLNDSLNIDIYYTDTIPNQLFEHNFICLGTYPNNKALDSNIVSYIQNIDKRNGIIYFEGGDALGYDKLGKQLYEVFGINNAEDGYNIYENTKLYFPYLNDSIIIDTLIKSADIYYTDFPYIIRDDYFGVYSKNTLCQSIPLNHIHFYNINFLYYMYNVFINNIEEKLEYDSIINLNNKNTFTIKNTGKNTLLITINQIPSFIDSVKSNKNFVKSDSTIIFQVFMKNNLSTNYSGIIKFSTGFNNYKIQVYYKNINSLLKVLSIKENKIIIESDEKIEILNNNFHYFIKKFDNVNIIYCNTSKLKNHILKLKIKNRIYYIPLNLYINRKIKKYNILGARTKINKSGIYFINNKKSIKINKLIIK